MAQKLSEEEVQQRLVRLRNLERLHEELKARYVKLEEQCHLLQQENAAQAALIEQLMLRIEDLERMVFGRRKKKHPDTDGGDSSRDDVSRKPPSGRAPGSYRRPLPTADAITSTEEHPLTSCPDCGMGLRDLKTAVRYEEDILPLAEWFRALKRVIKRAITTGYCPKCKARKTAHPLTPHTVTLGENVRQFVSFATVILRLSYGQVRDFLIGTMRLPVSDGEMAAMLGAQAVALRPEMERVKERVNEQPGAHYDESGWKVQEPEQGNHVWVKTGTEAPDAVFLLGRSRGKGNLDELKGPDTQPGVTDDYGAYRNAFTVHALCWSHPDRDFRDLKNSDALTDAHRQHCAVVYGEFAALYADVRAVCAAPFVLAERLRKKDEFMARFEEILQPHPDDPPTLATAKQSLLARRECYFVCVIRPGIPPDNNKAERALRHLVLKRKNSYGSKTQRMADRMSVLYSVLLSLWWKSKPTFFQEFAQLLNASP